MAPLVEMRPGKLSFFNIRKNPKSANILLEPKLGFLDCDRDVNTPFGPHGLDLVKRQDGRLQLAVVSHYPTETVEMFELKATAGYWSGKDV